MKRIKIEKILKSLIGMKEDSVFEDESGIKVIYFRNWGDQVIKLIITIEMLKNKLKKFIKKYKEYFEFVVVDGEKLLGLDVLEGSIGKKLRKELLEIEEGESLKGDIGMVLLTPSKKYVEIELILGINDTLDEIDVEDVIDVLTDVVDEKYLIKE